MAEYLQKLLREQEEEEFAKLRYLFKNCEVPKLKALQSIRKYASN